MTTRENSKKTYKVNIQYSTTVLYAAKVTENLRLKQVTPTPRTGEDDTDYDGVQKIV